MPGRTTLNITAGPARHGPAGSEVLTGPVAGFLLHTDDRRGTDGVRLG